MLLTINIYFFVFRWKCDRRGVVSVGVNSDGSVLVTAGRTMKIWSTTDHSLLRVRNAIASTDDALMCNVVYIVFSFTSLFEYRNN